MERRKVRLTIKATLTLAIGLTTALLILGVGIFSYYNTARVVEDAVIREARLVAEKNAEAISEWFRFIEEDMYLFSLVPAVRNLPVMSEGSTETVGVVAFAVALEELQQLAASMTLQGYGYADLFQEVARLRLTVAGMIAVALLVGFALAYGLAVSLSKPMVELTKSAERLGAGDLTAEVTV